MHLKINLPYSKHPNLKENSVKYTAVTHSVTCVFHHKSKSLNTNKQHSLNTRKIVFCTKLVFTVDLQKLFGVRKKFFPRGKPRRVQEKIKMFRNTKNAVARATHTRLKKLLHLRKTRKLNQNTLGEGRVSGGPTLPPPRSDTQKHS